MNFFEDLSHIVGIPWLYLSAIFASIVSVSLLASRSSCTSFSVKIRASACLMCSLCLYTCCYVFIASSASSLTPPGSS